MSLHSFRTFFKETIANGRNDDIMCIWFTKLRGDELTNRQADRRWFDNSNENKACRGRSRFLYGFIIKIRRYYDDREMKGIK